MDKLREIFDKQAGYIRDLIPTYAHNGFQQHATLMPWDLDGRRTQEEFRLLAWRFTEEIIEAYHASHYCVEPSPKQALNFREEVSDALHFFVELCLATGVERDEMLTGSPLAKWNDSDGDSLEIFFKSTARTSDFTDDDPYFEVVRAIGYAMASLRMRPWRTDFRPTDRRQWVMGLHLVFRAYVQLCLLNHITAAQLHEAYFAKAKVNQQRIKDHGVSNA